METQKRFLQRQPTFLLLLALAGITVTLGGPVLSHNSQQVFAGIAAGEALGGRLAVFAGCMGAAVLLRWAQTLLGFRWERRFCLSLQDALLGRLLGSEFFDPATLGSGGREQLNLLHQQAEEYSAQLCQFYLSAVSSGVLILGSAVYLALENLWLLSASAAVIGGLFLLSRRSARDIQRLQEQLMGEENHLSSIAWEHILNRDISPLLRPERLFRGYREGTERLNKTMIAMRKQLFPQIYVSMLGAVLATVLVVLLGSLLCWAGLLEPAALFGTALLIPGATGAVLGLPKLYGQSRQLRGMEAALSQLLHLTQYRREGRAALDGCPGSITARHLTLGYGEKTVVRDAAMQLKAGQVAVLAGDSGSGKSTLLRALCRLQPVRSGEILFGEQPLERLERGALWGHLGYLPQRPAVFPVSLRENVLGKQPPDQRYRRLVDALGLGRLDGRERLEPRELSSGERQKIALLRLFLGDKGIWMLDEPTSALDPQSEEAVLRELRRAAREEGRLILLISHREQTIQMADALYRLSDGTLTKEERRI